MGGSRLGEDGEDGEVGVRSDLQFHGRQADGLSGRFCAGLGELQALQTGLPLAGLQQQGEGGEAIYFISDTEFVNPLEHSCPPCRCGSLSNDSMTWISFPGMDTV